MGKSSLINSLCNRRKLCKTSATPGKTRLINVFLINEAFHLVDLPGYGFAKVDKAEKKRWGDMMDTYFQESNYLMPVSSQKAFSSFLLSLPLPTSLPR